MKSKLSVPSQSVGAKHWKPRLSFISDLHSLCGMVWCRTFRVKSLVSLDRGGEQTLICRSRDRLVGLKVKAFALRTEDAEFESRLRRDFSGSSHTSDFKIGTPVATLPGAWRYRVSAGTGWPGVSIL